MPNRIGVKSVYKHCGSTAESNLDSATGVQPAKKRENLPASSDPVLVIGSITLWDVQALDAADPQSFTLPPGSTKWRCRISVG
jgi:hypothetical protein